MRALPVLLALPLLAAFPDAGRAQDAGADLRAAIEAYDQAFRSKDLDALHAMLADDVVLYEHSVQNIGKADVWDHHLRPELEAFQDMTSAFTEVRVWASTDAGFVTRQYSIQANMRGRAIDARGNETQGWVKRDGLWLLAHVHWSHPCPRPAGG